MSNFENENLNYDQNNGNMNFNNNQNNFNQNLLIEKKIENEIKIIKNIKILTLFQIIFAALGTIYAIYLIRFSEFIPKLNPDHYTPEQYHSFVKLVNDYNFKFIILMFLGIVLDVIVITLGIIMLVKNSRIKLVKANKSLILSSAIISMVAIIPLFGIIPFIAYIVLLVSYFSLNKVLKNIKK